MKRTGSRILKDWIFENGSYKLVALFVTLILWVTILGRRDFVLSKEVDVEFIIPPSVTIAKTDIAGRVSVKVSGPRMALKRFAQNPGNVTIDLGQSQPGQVRAVISASSVRAPFGVKVLSVTPDVINVSLVAAKDEGAQDASQPSEQSP